MKPSILVFVEFIIGAAIALIFHVVLDKPDIAYTILAISILIAFATHLLIVNLSTQIKDRNEIYLLLDEIKDQGFKEKGIKIIEECKNKLKDLSEGYHMHSGEDEILLEGTICIKKAKDTIYANSLIDQKIWNEPIFSGYFEENKKAVERGVNVSRTFILDDEDIKDDEIKDILKRQNDANFNVFYAMSDKVPHELKKDFVIIDEKVVFSLEMGEKGKIVAGKEIKKQRDVDDYIEAWKKIRRRSMDVSDLIKI